MANLPRPDLPRPDERRRVVGSEPSLRPVRPAGPEIGPDLRAAFTVVWMRKWSILAVVLLIVGVALFASSRQTPVYESEVRILITPVSGPGTESSPLLDPNLATEAELIDSVAVAEIVADMLDIPGPPRQLLNDLNVDQPTDTEILEVSYRHADPAHAQRAAAAFADAYLEFRAETVTEALLESAEGIEGRISILTRRLTAVERVLREMSEDDPSRSARETEANFLRTELLQLQLEEVVLPSEPTVGRIIQPAPLPLSPVSPNHVVNGIFGLVVGLGLGVGLAFVRDRLSERLRSPEEVEAYLEAPVFASIPRVTSWRRRRRAFLVAAIQWRSPAAEAYRVLRANVLSAASAYDVKSIAVTSAHAGEGKSATVANLAVVLARAGKRVCIVSADLRRPRLHEFFKRDGEPGLIEILAGQLPVPAALQKITLPSHGFDAAPATLHLLPSGRVPDDPTELITSEAMAKTLKSLEDASDIVLVDVPPVLPVSDALVVAALTRNVLFVIGPRADTRVTVSAARQQLDRIGARIIGGVLNGPDASMSQTYYPY